jgi:hypothetical protein
MKPRRKLTLHWHPFKAWAKEDSDFRFFYLFISHFAGAITAIVGGGLFTILTDGNWNIFSTICVVTGGAACISG